VLLLIVHVDSAIGVDGCFSISVAKQERHGRRRAVAAADGAAPEMVRPYG
jgi:hypothetical protein